MLTRTASPFTIASDMPFGEGRVRPPLTSPLPHRGKVEIPTDGGFALVNRACAGSDGFTQEVPGAGPIVRLRKGCINTS